MYVSGPLEGLESYRNYALIEEDKKYTTTVQTFRHTNTVKKYFKFTAKFTELLVLKYLFIN
jgi:hypothetical protein